MLSAIAIGILIAGVVIGWKLRGFWERRPRIMRWGKNREPEASAAPKPAGGNGVVDRLSRTGERIVGKGVETIFGKPKKPKDDTEDE
ncbi:MAG: hypothetical protein AAB554_04760 [Patescibacteria group bacterium]